MNVRNDDECPICLVPLPLLITSCNHHACQTCLERILFATQSSPSIGTIVGEENIATDEALEEFIISNSPTCGRCPFCRKCISLFDLKIERGEDNETKFMYEKRYDIWRTALSGMSFQDGTQNIILNFPNTDNEQPNVTITVDPNRDFNISFEKGHFFHEKTNMFHGTIDLSKSNHTRIQEKWDLVMQFASDFRFVIHGAIIKRPVGNISDESLDEVTAYPLAGVWVVRWQRSDQRGVDRNSLDAARLTVHGNSFYFQGLMYHINLGDEYEARVHFSWPSYLGSFKQVAESGIDLQHNPNGPNVGETIVWNTTNPNFFRIFWTRETKETSLPPFRVQRLGARGTTFVKLQQTLKLEKPIYHSGAPWGNVFVQGLTVGYASYHFVSPDGDGEYGAYISYEHIKCSYWPPLDDGSPVPSRVPFVNISYEPSTRTFRGQIPWHDRYGTSWQKCTSWEYEMTFDSEFLCIVAGEVKNITNSTNQLPCEVHSYGHDLNYINCALPEEIHRESSEADRHIMRMRERLLKENVPQRTLVYIMQASIRVLENHQDIFDYNI